MFQMLQFITITENDQEITHYHNYDLANYVKDLNNKKFLAFEDPFRIFRTISIIELGPHIHIEPSKINLGLNNASKSNNNDIFNNLLLKSETYLDLDKSVVEIEIKFTIGEQKQVIHDNNIAAIYEIFSTARKINLLPFKFYIKKTVYHLVFISKESFLIHHLVGILYVIRGVLKTYLKNPEFSSENCILNFTIFGETIFTDITNIQILRKNTIIDYS